MLSTTTDTCGHNTYTLLLLFPVSLERKPFFGMKNDLAFECMKALIVQDCLLITTDDSSYWMRAYIAQDDKFVAFWSFGPASPPYSDVEFYALPCIDSTTNLVELTRIFDRSSNHIATGFKHAWLSQWPKPMQVISDNGGESTGFAFQQLFKCWI